MKINLIGGIVMKIKKLFATLFAVTMLTSGATTLVSDAEDSVNLLTQEELLSSQNAVLEECISNGELNQEEAEQILSELSYVMDSQTESYKSYTRYNDSNIAPTSHVLAFFTTTNTYTCFIPMYLNQNIITNNPLTLSNYVAPESNANVTQVSEQENIAYTRKFHVKLTVSDPSYISANKIAFYYLIPGDLSTSPNYVSSELELLKYTSQNYANDTINTITDVNALQGYPLKKCVVARGDVNRDGIVDSDDSILIQKEIVGLMTGSTLNKLAFRLAADCDGDGSVDILDVITLNSYLQGNGTL